MRRSIAFSLVLSLGLVLGAGVAGLAPAGRGQEWSRKRDLRWEYLPGTISLHRAKVPGGWLVVLEQPTRSGVVNTGCSFYPDPRHEWDGGSLP